MLYFILFSYWPNSAATNRQLAYFNALEKLQRPAIVFFLTPDRFRSKISASTHYVKYEYLWDNFSTRWTVLNYIKYHWNLLKLRRRFRAGDIIYTYGIDSITKYALGIDGVRVFAERTEHPDASSGFNSKLLIINKVQIKKCIKQLSGLFVISEPLKEYYISQGASEDKVHIINMIVDPNRFVNLHKTTNERYIAYCGTASNNKDGVDELIRAFSIVCKEINNIRLYIIGSTPSKEQHFSNYELVKSLGLENRVVFTGIVKSEEMPQLLKNAEILALDRPENMQAKYGFPTKLGEYLLTQNPTVVTSVGDITKFLKDGVSTLISKPSNPQEFASKIIWALTHTKEASKIARNGYDVALRNFNSVQETEKLLNVLSSY